MIANGESETVRVLFLMPKIGNKNIDLYFPIGILLERSGL